MFLSATMTIDPTSLTQIRRKPTKGFRRFAELLTANLTSKKEEHETFTALSILQELNVALRSIGVTDVVKFTKDDQTLYDDSASDKTDDMPQVIEALSRARQPNLEHFSGLSMLLEHHLTTIALILEIRVLRIHEVGIYPIQISINGLDAQMQSAETPMKLNKQLDQVFESQQTYDAYIESKKAEFEAFVAKLELAFRSGMKIENLHCRIYTNIVRPGLTPSQSPAASPDYAGTDSGSAPIFQRYPNQQHGVLGDHSSLMYLWMWSSMMHSHNTHCQHTTIVDESGRPAFSVGGDGFNAGEAATLDPGADFQAPDCEITPVEGVGGEASSSTDFGIFSGDGGSASDTGSSWFDSFSFGGDTSGDGGSSCASGAPCGSSCGSGCGGGCGS